MAMLAIRGIYDGKAVKILPSEPVPTVQGEVPVAIAHLQVHVEMKRVLSREQIDTYDALQGYTANAGSAPPTEHHRRQH
jgi:hypothetical protein